MREVLSTLVKLADHLDNQGFKAEADMADDIIKTIQGSMHEEEEGAEENEKKMMPMKDDKEAEAAEACVMKDAEANLKKVQMRRRARRRMLLVKQG